MSRACRGWVSGWGVAGRSGLLTTTGRCGRWWRADRPGPHHNRSLRPNVVGTGWPGGRWWRAQVSGPGSADASRRPAVAGVRRPVTAGRPPPAGPSCPGRGRCRGRTPARAATRPHPASPCGPCRGPTGPGRLGQPRQHQQHPQARLHRRVDPGTHVGRGPQGCPRAGVGRGGARRAQVLGGQPPVPHQRVTHHDQVDEAEHPTGRRHLREADTRRPRTVTTWWPGAATWLRMPSRRRSFSNSTLNVLVGQGGQRYVVHAGRTHVAGERGGRVQHQRCLHPEQRVGRHRRVHVDAGEDPAEPPAPQRGRATPAASASARRNGRRRSRSTA